LVQTPAEVAAALDDGRAATCFEAWVAAQGGEVARLDTLEVAPDQELVRATDSGVLGRIDAEKIGLAVVALGGGRKAKGDRIDLSVGASLHAKVGQELRAGEPILTLHHRAGRGVEEARALLADALAMSTVDSRGTARGLILGTVLP
jgi:pyrimidine-nucleoside phosphorylase/thymidine phosphorylase